MNNKEKSFNKAEYDNNLIGEVKQTKTSLENDKTDLENSKEQVQQKETQLKTEKAEREEKVIRLRFGSKIIICRRASCPSRN